MQRFVRFARLTVLAALLIGIAVAATLLFTTETGQFVREHPHEAGLKVHAWVVGHRVIAPLVFVAAYVLLIVLMFPVWWLQILAGYGFGLYLGVLWCQCGATIGSAIGFLLSRFVAAEWFHQHVESKAAKLRAIEEKLGHNGLLVVFALRLMHGVPIGLSNYLLGLTRITLADVVIGTAIAGTPTVALYVAMGTGIHPWHNWRFLTCLVALNVVLLSPVLLRYWRPEWFKKIGVE